MKLLLLADPASSHVLKWANGLSRKGIEVFIFGLSDYNWNEYDKNIQISSKEQSYNLVTEVDLKSEICIVLVESHVTNSRNIRFYKGFLPDRQDVTFVQRS